MHSKLKHEPIALVGHSCIIPGCNSPEELWNAVQGGENKITPVASNYWGVAPENIVSSGKNISGDQAFCSEGGYVSGFNWNPDQFPMDNDYLNNLDPLFKWSLQSAFTALKNISSIDRITRDKTSVILGNLSYPNPSHAKLYEESILHNVLPDFFKTDSNIHPDNRLGSSLPAQLIAKNLDFKGDAFCLDAACASSLYAIKIACDQLRSGSANLVLAGGINAADSLFLHVGFSALNALSPTGQSRPFNKNADGLIPAEGVAFLALKRLSDAIGNGDEILGLVQGVGLSNDGRDGGFLSPSIEGQDRCIRSAYSSSGVDPSSISYIECHATGTPTGDSREIESMIQNFGVDKKLPIGSLKGNIGHLITASGAASVIKVLQAFKHRTLPYNLSCDSLISKLEQSQFYLPSKNTPWNSDTYPRRAAVNGFGFGGNNAHIILEEWDPINFPAQLEYTKIKTKNKSQSKVALVGIEVQYADIKSENELFNYLSKPDVLPRNDKKIYLKIKDMGFPPKDIEQSIGQQTLLLQLLENKGEIISKLDPDKTAVFIGMEVDSESNKVGLRIRLNEYFKKNKLTVKSNTLAELKNQITPPINAAHVIGCMPNICANRINNKYNFRGQGFTFSGEKKSTDYALSYALGCLQNNEIESAIVGAVEIGNEALQNIIHSSEKNADAAIIWILCNLNYAGKHSLPILAELSNCTEDNNIKINSHQPYHELKNIYKKFGSNPLVTNLFESSFKIWKKQSNIQRLKITANPLLKNDNTPVSVTPEIQATVKITGDNLLKSYTDRRELALYCGSSLDSLIHNITNDIFATINSKDDYRAGFFFDSADKFNEIKSHFLKHISSNKKTHQGWNKYYCYYSKPIKGELAFMFTGAASAYPESGSGFLSAYPLLSQAIKQSFGDNLEAYSGWMYPSWSQDKNKNTAFNDLSGSSFICQLHSAISQKIWGLKEDACFGLSSGETNSIFALNIWKDLPALFDDIWQSNLYQYELCTSYKAVADYWQLGDNTKVRWKSWVLFCDVSLIQAMVDAEERVYITIISSPSECVIAGDELACERVLQQIPNIQRIPLKHDLAVHAPVLGRFTPIWKKIHTREVQNISSVRLYSNYFGGQYTPTSEKIAEALTGQASQTINFPKIVRKVYNSGVRVFIEHGPRDSLSRSIKSILSEQELKSVLLLSMDDFSKDDCELFYKNTIELWCSGQTLALDSFKLKNSNKISKLAFNIRKADIKLTLEKPQVHLESVHNKSNEISTINKNKNTVLNSRTMPSAPQLRNLKSGFHATKTTHNTPDSQHNLLLNIVEQQAQIHTEYLQIQLNSFQVYNQNLEQQMHALLNNQSKAEVINFVVPHVIHKDNSIIEKHSNYFIAEVDKQLNPSVEILSEQVTSGIKPSLLNKYDYNPTGPTYSREELEVLSSSTISSVFGEIFSEQDKYPIQVRMPEPPLLLCDRVTGIDAIPKSLQLGTVWTETDVTSTSWYTHNGYMPAGIFIEAGQADLLLISYLGVDFENKGERAYRLLGCELEILGDLPKVGDTLQYKICVDGHAQSGKVRLFFFHYDCYINGKKRIKVRNGQAGFFNTEELADSSGVLWDPTKATYSAIKIPESPVKHTNTRFSQQQIQQYLNGNLVDCFGENFFWTQTHTRTPTTANDKMNFIQVVTEINTHGGPEGRGYFKSITKVSPDDWFFEGHFKNDPCMPGTLMAEGCIQMMSFYLIAHGYSLKTDGWRFQPIPNNNYKFHCRGQVTPKSNELIYELFIDEIITEPHPILYAHVLCTVDGRKAFLCERLGVELIPDWPLSKHQLTTTNVEPEQCVEYNGFKFDHQSLLNCAWGKPTNAFGENYKIYNKGIRSSRLPGPPYHFMSRITELNAEFGNPYNQPSVSAEYKVSKEQWFFKENGSNTMPYCVLMEIALQPCGWLASFCRDNEVYGDELLFRNLDGFNAIQHIELPQDDYIFVTKVNLVAASRTGSLIINRFEIETFANNKLAYSYETAFGFFPVESMESQKGIKISPLDQLLLDQKSNINIQLTSYPVGFFNRTGPSLARSKLLMLDRVVYFDPEGGGNKKGYIRSEKDVNPEDWFFKAHFFQDPVQPGSLGVEAILQLMQVYIIRSHPEFEQSGMEFEPVVIGQAIEWHYRGQVTPDKELISVDVEISEEINDKSGCLIWAKAKLWVDRLKIYELPKVGMRLKKHTTSQKITYMNWQVDSLNSPWVLDHCPTYCIPTLPFTYLIELACKETKINLKKHGIHFEKIKIKNWMNLEKIVKLNSTNSFSKIKGEIKLIKNNSQTFNFEVRKNKFENDTNTFNENTVVVATGGCKFLDKSKPIEFLHPSPLKNIQSTELPYDSHDYFHGKSFHLLHKLEIGSNGSRAEINAQSKGVPHGASGFGLIDGAIQAIPLSNLTMWCPKLHPDLIAYPYQIQDLTLIDALPSKGKINVESRFIELIDNLYIKTAVWMIADNKALGFFWLIGNLVSKGISKNMKPQQCYDFIVKKKPINSGVIHKKSSSKYSLTFDDIRAIDWLPGTLNEIYGLPNNISLEEKTRFILIKEFIAKQRKCHPKKISLNSSLLGNDLYLEQNHNISIHRNENRLELISSKETLSNNYEIKKFDITKLIAKKGFQSNLFSDLIVGLCEQFIGDIIFEDFNDFNNSDNCIYLANHQVAIESFLFSVLTYLIKGARISTISKSENSEHWLGKIQRHAENLYSDKNPLDILYFNRDKPEQLISIVENFLTKNKNTKQSLFVHAGGTREQYEEQGIIQMSSFILDQAVKNMTPVIPVLFINGLPITNQGVKFELPYKLTKQKYFYGKSIQPDDLAALKPNERKVYFLNKLKGMSKQLKKIKKDPLNIEKKMKNEIQDLAKNNNISIFTAVCIYILYNRKNASKETDDFVKIINSENIIDELYNKVPIFNTDSKNV